MLKCCFSLCIISCKISINGILDNTFSIKDTLNHLRDTWWGITTNEKCYCWKVNFKIIYIKSCIRFLIDQFFCTFKRANYSDMTKLWIQVSDQNGNLVNKILNWFYTQFPWKIKLFLKNTHLYNSWLFVFGNECIILVWFWKKSLIS